MNVLLTGASGFVGGHVARALADQGAKLRLLARKTSNLETLRDLNADIYVGDLAEPESLRAGLMGCEALVHVAADYRLWIPHPASMYRVNVDGTRALLKLAREAGVRRAVYTSSVATLHFFKDGSLSNEDTPTSEADMLGHYKRSKFLAEQEALAAAHEGLDLVVLNPSAPVGAGDVKPTPTGRILVDFLKGRFPAYMDTGLNLVDVREVARIHASALTQGQAGQRYILGGENLTLKQIFDKLAALSGRSAPKLRIPYALALAYAGFEENLSGRLLKREPRATLEQVRMGRKKMYVSSERAQRELGFRILPIEPALAAAVTWFRER
ncbi:MAG: hopanoid-associated sugar epimerase, partial [bacterium]